MHVVIAGAGVIGTLSAYYLAKAGFKVTVIDRRDDVAREASAANASQLSYYSLYCIGNPSILPGLSSALLGVNADIQVRKYTDPYFWRWGAGLLLNCFPHKYRRNSEKLLGLSSQSAALFRQLIEDHDLDFGYRENGRLRLYPTRDSFEQAHADYEERHNKYGFRYETVSAAECIEANPLIANREGTLAGGLFTPDDGVGDTVRFCNEIKNYLEKTKSCDVKFKLNTNIESVEGRRRSRIEGLKTSAGEVQGDYYLFAAGARTPALLRHIGFDMNIYPVKGCSVTVPYKDGVNYADRITHNMTDLAHGIVIAPWDDGLRLSTGMVIDGYNQQEDPQLVDKLRKAALAVIPDLDFSTAAIHTGLRPATPSSLPVTRRLGKTNAFVNAGHGMWGWTLAPVTCKNIAEIIRSTA